MLEMEYTTLANEDMCWQRKDARSGGLLDWALHEMDSEEQERMLIPRSLTQPAAVVLPQPEKVVKRVENMGPPRTRLKHEEAVAIYLARHGPKSCKTAARLAAEFRITAKAVRDVWTKKTWTDQTKCVWTVQASKDYIATSHSGAVAMARVKRALQARSSLRPV
jgi:uncharacterized alpha-E superfamily protein